MNTFFDVVSIITRSSRNAVAVTALLRNELRQTTLQVPLSHGDKHRLVLIDSEPKAF